MARTGGRPDLGLVAVAWAGALGIVAAVGLAEPQLSDWWIGLGAGVLWAGATLALGFAQRGIPPTRTARPPTARPARSGPPRRPRMLPPGGGQRILAGPVHVDGGWVRAVEGSGGVRVEAWVGHGWLGTATNLHTLVGAMACRARTS